MKKKTKRVAKKVTTQKKVTKKVTKKKVAKNLAPRPTAKEVNDLKATVETLNEKIQTLTNDKMNDLQVFMNLKDKNAHLLSLLRGLDNITNNIVNSQLVPAAEMIMVQRDIVDNVCTEGPFAESNGRIVDTTVAGLFEVVDDWNNREQVNWEPANPNMCDAKSPCNDEATRQLQ